MEVYNDHGREAVRQRPGPKNALGFVKFMFPNDYNIYLHDTPNHELFKKDVRAFSHGCIRVEKPAELAQWVLGWTPERVEAAMHGSGQPPGESAVEDSRVHRLLHDVRRRRANLLRQRPLRSRQQVGQPARRARRCRRRKRFRRRAPLRTWRRTSLRRTSPTVRAINASADHVAALFAMPTDARTAPTAVSSPRHAANRSIVNPSRRCASHASCAP